MSQVELFIHALLRNISEATQWATMCSHRQSDVGSCGQGPVVAQIEKSVLLGTQVS